MPVFLILFSATGLCLHAQSVAASDGKNVPTYRADVQNVVVDVVVTDRAGTPTKGLHREDFTIREQGKAQQIASFEEHDGTPAAPSQNSSPRRQTMPPGVFTNEPSAPVSDVVNVLLLDSLNTAVSDQSYVHAQAIKYLKSMTPGTRIAIFTLSTQLRFVQGFTSDASKLSAALNQGNAVPNKSPLLSTPGEMDAQVDQASQLKSLITLDPTVGASMLALQQFQAENAASEGLVRITLTYQALQDLARYLSAVPGRKNVIWFAGSFPVSIAADAKSFEDNPDMSKTTNALAAARIALYPVRAGGVTTDSLYDVGTRMAGVTNGEDARSFQRSSLQQDSVIRATFSGIAGQLADNTGGEAIYGTNNLSVAVGRVVDKGAHYYTITYSPTDKRTDGRYRQIKVTIPEANYRLEYRRGYFADSSATIKQAARERATTDPLVHLMDPGLPDLTQVLFKVRVAPSDPQPPQATSAAVPATKDGPLAPTRPMDTTRYGADFAISMRDVRLGGGADGKRSGSIELMLVAFDRKGKALNFTVNRNQLELTPQGYQAMKDAGLQLHDEIDVPRGTTNIRVGVYDPDSNHAGTIQIPLSQLRAATPQPGPMAHN